MVISKKSLSRYGIAVLVLTCISRLLNGVNSSSVSNPNPPNKRRDLMLIAGLLYHPEAGLILFECGSTENIEEVRMSRVEARSWSSNDQGL